MLKFIVRVLTIIMITSASGVFATPIVVQDTINEINTEFSYRYGEQQGYATNVDYWRLGLNETGDVSIDILSWYYDFDEDGFSFCFDSVIYLFLDDGDLSEDDFVLKNDDASTGFGEEDGSRSRLDSYWSGELNAGSYILAISDNRFSLEDAIDGINNQGYAPIKVDLLDDESTTWESDEGNLGLVKYADYQITFDGFDSVAPVPEPSSSILFGCGLLGLVGFSRFRRKLNA